MCQSRAPERMGDGWVSMITAVALEFTVSVAVDHGSFARVQPPTSGEHRLTKNGTQSTFHCPNRCLREGGGERRGSGGGFFLLPNHPLSPREFPGPPHIRDFSVKKHGGRAVQNEKRCARLRECPSVAVGGRIGVGFAGAWRAPDRPLWSRKGRQHW